MRANTWPGWTFVGAVMTLAVLAVGCGDDAASGTVGVTAVDYRFEDLPKEAEAGTVLTLINESTREIHELVAVKLPDSEKRSAAELVKLPQDQLQGLFQGPPAMVLVAPPNKARQIEAEGDGTLRDRGRYLVACFTPTGADPGAYVAAVAGGGEGPPDVAGGPPHTTQGMFGEIKVV
ncbi:MAG: hypothetical protein M3144_07075 [Actinomycetota bacterium]|nr:hypothetical protein [Actinomycetota bacterium]